MAPSQMRIRRTEQLDALTSPVRQQIVDAVCGLGLCSVSDIAAALGRPADGLYYHLRRLVDVGLLIETSHPSRGQMLYTTPSPGILRLVYEPNNPENVARITRIVAGMLRTAERDFGAGFEKVNARVDGPDRNLNAARQTARLNAAQRREVNRLIHRIQAVFAEAVRNGEADGEFLSTTMLMAPLEDRPVRRDC